MDYIGVGLLCLWSFFIWWIGYFVGSITGVEHIGNYFSFLYVFSLIIMWVGGIIFIMEFFRVLEKQKRDNNH